MLIPHPQATPTPDVQTHLKTAPMPQSTPQPYTPENLQTLINQSDAYKMLTPEEQANIKEHIRQNNKPVLMYIYSKLQEEQQAHQVSLDRLTKKLDRLSPQDILPAKP